MSNFYWVHPESNCVGSCDTEEELHSIINADPLVNEIDESQYKYLIISGYES